MVETEFPAEEKFDHLPRRRGARGGAAAFLTVQEGCDKFCTFCVVPYTRGAEVSRPAAAIAGRGAAAGGAGRARDHPARPERECLSRRGAGRRRWTLAGLLARAWRGSPGSSGIRYTTSHPRDMDEDLIAAHGDDPKLMPYLHLPVQAGSDRVLQGDEPPHTAGGLLRLDRAHPRRPARHRPLRRLHRRLPRRDRGGFRATLELVRTVGYAAGLSPSPIRRGPAPPPPAWPAGPGGRVNAERLQRLQALLAGSRRQLQRCLRRAALQVLLEKPGAMPGQLIGRSPYLQAVHLEANAIGLAGVVVPVRDRRKLGADSLSGRARGRRLAAAINRRGDQGLARGLTPHEACWTRSVQDLRRRPIGDHRPVPRPEPG